MGFLKRAIMNKVNDIMEDSVNDTLDDAVDGLKKLLNKDDEDEGQNTAAAAKEKKLFCTNCGAQLEPDARFCVNCGTKVAQAASVQAAPVQAAPVPAAPADNDLNARFEGIFARNFPDYEVAKEVAAARVGIEAPAGARPYTYALCKAGKAAVVIMLTPHNRDNNAAYKNAKAAAGQAGVPFLNFYTHYTNEPDYIINRIHQSL